MIDSMHFDETIKSMLMHGSALNWLNLEKGVFQQ